MEAKTTKADKFAQSVTVKAFIIGFLTLILLVPGLMIQNLIWERQERSIETIDKINAKWSKGQRLCGPYLTIPYTTTFIDAKNKLVTEQHRLHVTPEQLNIETNLYPEERYYGIYKTILYKSDIHLSGEFSPINWQAMDSSAVMHWDKAYLTIGLSDLRGVSANIFFNFNSQTFEAEAGGGSDYSVGEMLFVPLNNQNPVTFSTSSAFHCSMKLNGSSEINYIPLGKTSNTGNYSPEYTIDQTGFTAEWNILRFNRNIPEVWYDERTPTLSDSVFGVNLVEQVDHYQQNMRSAKYAIMFIGLTFVVFFFVEILTHKKIHPIQYLLVGIALILFYSLLLSFSEQIGFGWSYLISSIAIISLISAYAYSIFKNKTQTIMLSLILTGLYLFLYVILQLEDIALLIGSIGLFLILATIMFFSRKIHWYKPNEEYLK